MEIDRHIKINQDHYWKWWKEEVLENIKDQVYGRSMMKMIRTKYCFKDYVSKSLVWWWSVQTYAELEEAWDKVVEDFLMDIVKERGKEKLEDMVD